MDRLKIGTLTIGQAPRPDLVASLKSRFPDAEIVEDGALDSLNREDLPRIDGLAQDSKSYLLTTRLRDGSLVTVPEAFLIRLMADGLKRLEAKGVKAIFLLCAGTFAELSSSIPLIKPFALAHEMLTNIGIKKIGIIAPIPEQERPIRQRWEAAGFETTVWTADATDPDKGFIGTVKTNQAENGFKALILDYVGHPAEVSQQIQAELDIPVVDLGELAVAALAAML